MGIRIVGTKKQKICVIVQIILLILGITIDIISNVYELNNELLLKISEYCSFVCVFVIPLVVNSQEAKKEDENKQDTK